MKCQHFKSLSLSLSLPPSLPPPPPPPPPPPLSLRYASPPKVQQSSSLKSDLWPISRPVRATRQWPVASCSSLAGLLRSALVPAAQLLQALLATVLCKDEVVGEPADRVLTAVLDHLWISLVDVLSKLGADLFEERG